MTLGFISLIAAMAGSGFQIGPVLFPFSPQYAFQVFAKVNAPAVAGILDVTNAQKLALTGITAGQQVRISDAFVLSNDPFWFAASNLYFANNTANGKPLYSPVNTSDGQDDIGWTTGFGGKWQDGVGIFTRDDVASPWLGTDAGEEHAGYVMTHPAIQSFLGGDPSDEANWTIVP